MVDQLHIPLGNRTKKPLAITLNKAGREFRRRDSGENVTNIQCKPNWNCHYEFLSYNEQLLIKNLR
jgi:hypothetical protein